MNNLPALVEQSGMTLAQIEKARNYTGHLSLQYLQRAKRLYVGGLTVEEIAEKYSEYTEPMLYRACLEHNWNQLRIVENQRAAAISVAAAGTGHTKALTFMNRVIEAVYTRYDKRLLDYITDPERAEYPQVTKSDFEQIERAVAVARDMMGLSNKGKDVNVNIGIGLSSGIRAKKIEDTSIEVNGMDVKQALIDSLKDDA